MCYCSGPPVANRIRGCSISTALPSPHLQRQAVRRCVRGDEKVLPILPSTDEYFLVAQRSSITPHRCSTTYDSIIAVFNKFSSRILNPFLKPPQRGSAKFRTWPIAAQICLTGGHRIWELHHDDADFVSRHLDLSNLLMSTADVNIS